MLTAVVIEDVLVTFAPKFAKYDAAAFAVVWFNLYTLEILSVNAVSLTLGPTKIISSTFLACNPLAIKIELKAVEKDLFSIDNVISLGASGLPLELSSELWFVGPAIAASWLLDIELSVDPGLGKADEAPVWDVIGFIGGVLESKEGSSWTQTKL